MSGWTILTIVGFMLSAVSSVVMAAWLWTHRSRLVESSGACGAAFAASSAWAAARPILGQDSSWGQLLLAVSYVAWLWALYRMFVEDGRHARLGPIRPVVLALGFVGLMMIAATLASVGQRSPVGQHELAFLGTEFRLLFCVGALVLVHNLYAGATGSVRERLRWPAAALAFMWFYDFNFQTVVWLTDRNPEVLASLRGLVPLVMSCLFAVGAVSRERQYGFAPSRAFTFQSFSLFVIGSYFALMVIAFQGATMVGGDFVRLVQAGFLVVATALALLVLPSQRLRGWFKVTVAKHLFKHRYDYREEWLRFTRTIGRAGTAALPLRERVIQAVADVTDSPAGLLLAPSEQGGLALEARWQWPGVEVPARAMEADGATFFAQSQFILDLDDWRAGRQGGIPQAAVPDWIVNESRAWAMIPLLHYERLLGVVVLTQPAFAHKLDWEDFDLLRVIGRQLASYLAEQGSQDALGEAQQFDEFNRRIAFVMHDIKNLASQLSLLSSNAERHLDKPEFRADMLVTLKNSTDKLNALIARLGRYGAQGSEEVSEIMVRPLLRTIADRYALQHKVVTVDGADLLMVAQPEAIEQALAHLVQNAVDASPPAAAVTLDSRIDGDDVAIEVIDAGSGMSAEYIRTRLFKPFQSSKPGGFGIGAYEAREMIRAMGGRLDVESREGLGTRFVVRLPRAKTIQIQQSLKAKA